MNSWLRHYHWPVSVTADLKEPVLMTAARCHQIYACTDNMHENPRLSLSCFSVTEDTCSVEHMKLSVGQSPNGKPILPCRPLARTALYITLLSGMNSELSGCLLAVHYPKKSVISLIQMVNLCTASSLHVIGILEESGSTCTWWRISLCPPSRPISR